MHTYEFIESIRNQSIKFAFFYLVNSTFKNIYRMNNMNFVYFHNNMHSYLLKKKNLSSFSQIIFIKYSPQIIDLG